MSEMDGKTKRELEKEIADKFCEIQSKLSNAANGGEKYTNADGKRDWNEFTEEFFQRQKTICPKDFKEKKDLALLRLKIDSLEIQKIKCEEWEFYFWVSSRCYQDLEQINFSSSKFHAGISFETPYSAKACPIFRSVDFFGTSLFKGHFSEANFSDSEFYGNAVFTGKFSGKTEFRRTRFLERCDFRSVQFEGNVDFEGSNFAKKADFSRSIFNKNSNFYWIRFSAYKSEDKNEKETEDNFPSFILDDAHFKGDSLKFLQDIHLSESDENYHVAALQNFSAKRAIFESPVIFDLQFEECPDFSETYFLKKHYIKETWLKPGEVIEDSKIKPEDESKFRFFKNYFAKEEGNHFKEQEYFSYEMKAREKRMKKEMEEKPCNFAKLTNWFLFLLYKWTSNYGMSVGRPALGMLISAIYFWLVFLIRCNVPYQFAFANAIKRTINPLSAFECGKCEISAFLMMILSFQFMINATLLFLLVLGIRNRFKIK